MSGKRAPRCEIHGIDFSGAAKAGRKIWIASGVADGDTLVIQECQRLADRPGAPRSRAAALAELRELVATHPAAVFGLDFPFGIPRELVKGATWEQFLDDFPARFPTARLFRQRCREATGAHELKRETDRAARTPFSAYNLWLYSQTYYGIRDVLGPLVRHDQARVLPMQALREDKPWVLEICPASTLKALEKETGERLYVSYKGGKKDQRDERAAQRRRILEALEATDELKELCLGLRDAVIADKEGDALDSIIAAFATFRAIRGPSFPEPEGHGPYALEGYVYV